MDLQQSELLPTGTGLITEPLVKSECLAHHNDVIVEGLVQQGWVAIPNYLDPELCDELRMEMLRYHEQNRFQKAGIGRIDERHRNEKIRRDKIYWLEGSTSAQRTYLDLMADLRQHINRELFLGLFDLEAHYAVYEPGDFYRKHLDAFRGRSSRVVTVVSYFNPQWREEDGGLLNIYDSDDRALVSQIMPLAGTLVCFLSEKIPHEVTPTAQLRCSVAGWFRHNGSTGELVDPPA